MPNKPKPVRDDRVTTLAAARVPIVYALVTCPALMIPVGQHPFDLHKAAFLWIATATAVAAVAASPAASRALRHVDSWRAAMAITAVLTIAAMTWSTVSSDIPSLAWWGSTLRAYGTLTEIALLLVAIVVLLVADDEFVGRLQTAAIIGSVAPAIYGACQLLHLDPLKWDVGVLSRPSSTFGNPLFFAGYLVTVIPLTIGRAIVELRAVTEKRAAPARAVALWSLVLLQCAMLVATRTRGPALAVVAAFAFGGVLAAAALARRPLKWIPAAVMLLGALAFVVATPAMMRVPDQRAAAPVFQSASAGDTTAVRLVLWRAVARGIQASRGSIAFGLGPESTSRLLSRYGGPALPDLEGPDTAPDRAHNLTLERLSAFGIAGVILQFLMGVIVIAAALSGAGLLQRPQLITFAGVALTSIAVSAIVMTTIGGLAAIALTLPVALAILLGGWIVWPSAARAAGDSAPWTVVMLSAALGGWFGHLVDATLSVETIASSLNAFVAASLVVVAGARAWRAGAPAPADHAADTREAGDVSSLLIGWTAALTTIALSGAARDAGGMVWVIAGVTWIAGLAVTGAGVREAVRSLVVWVAAAGVMLLWRDGSAAAPYASALAAADRLVVLYVLAGACALAAVGRRAWRSSALVFAVVASVVAATVVIRRASADVLMQAAAAVGASDPQSAIALYRESVERDPLEAEAFTKLGEALMTQAAATAASGPRNTLFGNAADAMQRARAADPFDYHHLRNIAVSHRQWARLVAATDRPAHQAEADRWYREAVELAPDRGALWAEWGNLDAEQGNLAAAFSKLERGASLGAATAAAAVGDAILRVQRRDVGHAAGLRDIAIDFRSRGFPALAALYERRAAAMP
jgi:hypothetical protein